MAAHVVAWVDHNPRSAGLAAALGCEVTFMPWAANGQPLPRTIAGWVRSAAATRLAVRRTPADATIVVQAPPVFAPLVAVAAAGSRAVVVDVHSGAINQRRWRWSVPLLEACLRRAAAAVFTNDELVRELRTDGIEVMVLHDPLVDRRADPDGAPARRSSAPVVVFPASGGADEPLNAVADAADHLAGEVDVVVTGRVGDRLSGTRARTTGFLPREAYQDLLASADAVLALTTTEATMQRSGYEALELGLPIVCSDTRVLRETLGDAAVFVDNDGASLAAGIRTVLGDRSRYAAGARAALESLLARQENDLRWLVSRPELVGGRR